MRKMSRWLCITVMSVALLACMDKPEPDKVKIGINAWPGYEFLYLASQKGFFEQQGLHIELMELSSLADCTRVFNQGRLDGIASSMIEAVKIVSTTPTQLEIVLVSDYSHGGDVILAKQPINAIADLKGKTVGVELGLLGSFILEKALMKAGVDTAAINILNIEQLNAHQYLQNGLIDAVVTYSPFDSTIIAEQKDVSAIFSTAEIPGEVIDIVVLRQGVLNDPVQWQQRFFKAWQQAIDYSLSHPEQAYAIMAERQGISVDEFITTLQGIDILDSTDQYRVFESEHLAENISDVCLLMKKYAEYDVNCVDVANQLTILNH